MSDLFKSTYNPDALSCITTRRRLEGRGRAQSAPESGGGFPGGVFPVGPSPKVPGRLAGGSVSGGGSAGTGRHPAPAPARGQGSGAKCPGIWRGVPRRRFPSWAVSQSAREAGGGLRRHRSPPGAARRRRRTPPGRHHLPSAAVTDYKKGRGTYPSLIT